MKLENKVAIITGAASGLGEGIACCFAEEGADLVIADMDMDNANRVAEKVKAYRRRALVVEADVTQPQMVKQLVENTVDTFGKIDILVNNVGGGRPRPAQAEAASTSGSRPGIVNLSEEDWDDAYEVNLKSQVLMCKVVVPYMRAQKSGKIINISSIAGKVGDSNRMPYSTLKGGVVIFTRALARELARDNINVNCICPGQIYTPSWQRSAEYLWRTVPIYRELKEPKDVFMRYIDRLTLLKREQTPEDIGRAAVFLASEDSRNITAQSLNVDGGQVVD